MSGSSARPRVYVLTLQYAQVLDNRVGAARPSTHFWGAVRPGESRGEHRTVTAFGKERRVPRLAGSVGYLGRRCTAALLLHT
jgi:hypothetical protein